jgi:acyl carrier protein
MSHPESPDLLFEEIALALPRPHDVPLTPETRLQADLGLDSIDLVELLGTLEDRLGVTLEPAVGRGARTVGDLVARLRARRAAA